MDDLISDGAPAAESSAWSVNDQQTKWEAVWPKLQALIEEYEAKSITTMMVCCVPSRYGMVDVRKAVGAWGSKNTFDLVFLPCRNGKGNNNNHGFAFVNFKTAKSAAEFACVSDDALFPNSMATKRCCTNPAECQGYQANFDKHSKKNGKTGILWCFWCTLCRCLGVLCGNVSRAP